MENADGGARQAFEEIVDSFFSRVFLGQDARRQALVDELEAVERSAFGKAAEEAWVSVEDQQPKVGGTYLTWDKKIGIAVGYFIIFEDGGKWSNTGTWPDPKNQINHWRELPKSPARLRQMQGKS